MRAGPRGRGRCGSRGARTLQFPRRAGNRASDHDARAPGGAPALLRRAARAVRARRSGYAGRVTTPGPDQPAPAPGTAGTGRTGRRAGIDRVRDRRRDLPRRGGELLPPARAAPRPALHPASRSWTPRSPRRRPPAPATPRMSAGPPRPAPACCRCPAWRNCCTAGWTATACSRRPPPCSPTRRYGPRSGCGPARRPASSTASWPARPTPTWPRRKPSGRAAEEF